MTNTLSKMFIFAIGTAVGSVATWAFLKTRYEKLIEEDIASVKEYYERRNGNSVEETVSEPDKEENEAKDDLDELIAVVEESGYTRYGDATDTKKEVKSVAKPYVVPPKKFGDCDYDTITLTYYDGDEVLADDADEPIFDVDDVVGRDSLNHFGENDDDPDIVYVRNDDMKTDYEICREFARYSDVVGDSRYRAEDE